MKTFFLATVVLVSLQLVVGPDDDPTTELLPITDIPKLTPPITNFLKQIPNLFGLCTAIKGIPHRTVLKIKDFLESIIPQLPEGNLIRFHFTNVVFLLNSYKNIIDLKKKKWKEFTDAVQELEEPEPAMFRSLDDINEDVGEIMHDIPKPLDILDNFVNPFDPFPKDQTPKKKAPKMKNSYSRKPKEDIPEWKFFTV